MIGLPAGTRVWLAARAAARCAALALQLLQFFFQRRQIDVGRLIEQVELVAAVHLAGLAETDAPVVRQFQRQRLDLEILGLAVGKQLVLLNPHGLQLRLGGDYPLVLAGQHSPQLRNERRVGIGQGELFEQIHAGMLTERRLG